MKKVSYLLLFTDLSFYIIVLASLSSIIFTSYLFIANKFPASIGFIVISFSLYLV